MSQPNLQGVVSKVERLDSARAAVTVDLVDPNIPADKAVEGSMPTIVVPMPLDKVKSFGLGAEVEITLKKKTAPRAKAETKTEASDGQPDASDEGNAGDPEPVATPAAAAPAGRRRAAASGPAA